MLSGFINLYKNEGMSSNKALSILKYHLKQNNISTKVGHFGTLDPIAEGVLPVALGRAARLFDYSLDKIKRYKAVFEFGIETDTLDRTGVILSERKIDVTADQVNSVIPSLIGEVMQIPPRYSAKNVGGDRAYRLARNGVEFDLPPKKVIVYGIELKKQIAANVFEFDIECGGGTYIRSIVRDMAEKLGTVGIMNSLLRSASGCFELKNAVKLENLEKNLLDNILPIDYVLKDMGVLTITEEQFSFLKNGVPVDCTESDGIRVVYTPDGTIMGIGLIQETKMRLKTWLL